MGDTVLEANSEERDLGVIVDAQLAFDTHINEIIKKGNIISGLLLRTILSRSPAVLVPLFKALVCPILEYGNAVWSPCIEEKHSFN
jgi:hypothetical protein